MKKILLAVLALMMISGCQAKNSEPTVNLPNPMVEYGSLNELNTKMGSNLVKPAVMGVTDEKFFVIANEIAEYDFALNGTEYTLRFSKNDEDISGIYEGESTIFAEHVHNQRDVHFGDDYKAAIWCTDKGTYTLVVKDNGEMDEERFTSVLNELVSMTVVYTDRDLSGTYADMVSQRATMTVEKNDTGYDLTISWSSSADKTDEWLMSVTVEHNDLCFDGIEHRVTEGTCLVSEQMETSGMFTVAEDHIMCTYVGVEELSDCVFELIG